MSDARSDRFIHANGIDIHIIEAGAGEPLILLENGMISTNPLWSGWMSSYGSHVETLAQHFRVIVPDFRGSGRTVHPGGPVSHNLLADDMAALSDALQLGPPFICGYGDGGVVATVIGIRKPDLHTITAPTLILVGDGDPFRRVEEGASAYRALPRGELAVLPNTANGITPAAIEATVQFFLRGLD
ncbi:MAG TPA: alpha/beta hydrolase [Streptosporangiaceae bacterium]